MLRVARAGLAAALLTLAWVLAPAIAAEKPFKQSALDEAAIKLEAQIKSDAGAVAKPAATLRRDADTAFQKNEFRSGMVVLSQLVTVAPDDASSWLRLARTILQIKPRDDREKALLFDRASTAAYIAYQRAGDRNLEADSLSVLGRTLADRQQWRGALDSLRLSLELRETAELRGQYEKLRAEHGFRLLDFTVDSELDRAARLFPVLRGIARPSYRFFTFRRGRRHGPAGDIGRRKTALRGGSQARRALFDNSARRAPICREGNARKVC